MAGKHIRFAHLLEQRLAATIKRRFGSGGLPINEDLIRVIRDHIRDEITEVFAKSTQHLSFEALAWLADQHLKCVKANEDQVVGDLIIINEYPLADMPFSDIELMRNLFNETVLGPALEEEYAKRSQS